MKFGVDLRPGKIRKVEMASERAEYGISDLSRLYSLSLRTLRFYEDKHLLRPRRDGQKRVFSDADRCRLEIILHAKRLGFSLANIRELLESRTDEIERCEGPTTAGLGLTTAQIRYQIALLSRERARVHAAIEELRTTAARLGIDPPGD